MSSLAARVVSAIRARPIFARAVLYSLPDLPVHVRIPEIGRFRIRVRRNRSMWLRDPLAHEWYPLAALKSFVTPGDIVWDAGANIGLYSRWIAGHLNARHVVAFEPMSANVQDLEYNIRLGSCERKVSVVRAALSDTDGPAEFQIDDIQSASGSLSSVRGGAPSAGRAAVGLPPRTETVACRSIDHILQEEELPAPDVLKIDVEGAEMMTLRGGERFFGANSPKIVIETHGADLARSCVTFLLDRGYSLAGCVPEEWSPGRHLRLDRDTVARIQDQYDVHFIMAARDPNLIPDELNYSCL